MVYTNLFIGACAVAMFYHSRIIMGLHAPAFTTTAFIFFSTVSAYSILKIRPFLSKTHTAASDYTLWLAKNKVSAYTVLASASIIAGLLAFTLSAIQLALVILAGFITLVYSIPFIGNFSLRGLGILKTFFVAVVWIIMTTIISFDANIHDLGDKMISVMLSNLFFILPLCIAFEIKDMDDDEAAGLLTIPMYLGIGKTKMLAIAIPICYIAASFIIFVYNGAGAPTEPAQTITTMLPSIASVVVLQQLNKESSSYYFQVLIDGLMLLQFLCTFIAYS